MDLHLNKCNLFSKKVPISPPQGLPPEEDCQRPKTFAAFSPPKSLSDAGGGLCGLNEQYSFYLGTLSRPKISLQFF